MTPALDLHDVCVWFRDTSLRHRSLKQALAHLLKRHRPPVVASQSRILVSIPSGPTQRANNSGSVCARISCAGVASKSRVMRIMGNVASASIETR